MSKRRGKILIALVWIISFLICLPPLLGWREPPAPTSAPEMSLNLTLAMMNLTTIPDASDPVHPSSTTKPAMCSVPTQSYHGPNYFSCQLTSARGYVIYSALGSFWIPMFFMLFFYWRIYRTALSTIRSFEMGYKTVRSSTVTSDQGSGQVEGSDDKMVLRVHRGNASNCRRTFTEGTPNSTPKVQMRALPRRQNGTYSPSTCPDIERDRELTTSSSGKSGNIRLKAILLSHSKQRDSRAQTGDLESDVESVEGTNKGIGIEMKSRPVEGIMGEEVPKTNSYTDEQTLSKNNTVREGMHVTVTLLDSCSTPTSSVDTSLVDRPCVSVRARTAPPDEMKHTAEDHQLRSVSQQPPSNTLSLSNLANSSSPLSRQRKQMKSHFKSFSREAKAAKTLAIIIGAFIVCWMPFFTIYLVPALCQSPSDCEAPTLVFDIFFWLGYCNSALNPLLYAVFSKDFRAAFRRILTCGNSYARNSALSAGYGGTDKWKSFQASRRDQRSVYNSVNTNAAESGGGGFRYMSPTTADNESSLGTL